MINFRAFFKTWWKARDQDKKLNTIWRTNMRLTAVLAGVLMFSVILLTDSPKVSAETASNTSELSAEEILELLDQKSLADDLAPKDKKKTQEKKVVKHVVAEGDTLVAIADFYEIDWKRIFNKNKNIDDPNILNPGITIVIPKDKEKLPNRVAEMEVEAPEPVEASSSPAPQTSQNQQPAVQTMNRGSSAGNKYAFGYCTWYAKQKRPDLPNQMGNAVSWASSARAMGIPTGSKAQVGAIGQRGNHVVYVEKINGNGTINISDMNYAGLGVVTNRTVPANSYTYIYK